MLSGRISLGAFRELRGGRAVRLVGSHSLGNPSNLGVVVPVLVSNHTRGVSASNDIAVDAAWNSSKDGGGGVREMHLE